MPLPDDVGSPRVDRQPQPRPVEPRPVEPGSRAAAPDLARGAALLGIALANSVVQLYGRETGPSSRPVDGSAADRAVDVVGALLVDNRGYPLFAFLIGYGTAQLFARQQADGVPGERTTAVLLRRSLALVALGAMHAALLFSGDILGLYGLLTVLVVLLLRESDRLLLAVTAVCLVPLGLLGLFDGLATGGSASRAEPDYLVSVGLRLSEWSSSLLAAPLFGVGILAPMLLGVLAARRRYLDDPAAHVVALRRAAVAGVTMGVLGGVPLALTSTGAVAASSWVDAAAGAVQGLTGLAGALGYAALAGLLALGTGPVRRALVATGRRSLSCYLAQSVLMVPLLAAWGAGLGAELGTAGAAALAASVWLLTVLGASALERAGRRGPAEVVLRRFVYGRQPTERHSRPRSSAT